jgi:hypothetical protein
MDADITFPEPDVSSRLTAIEAMLAELFDAVAFQIAEIHKEPRGYRLREMLRAIEVDLAALPPNVGDPASDHVRNVMARPFDEAMEADEFFVADEAAAEAEWAKMPDPGVGPGFEEITEEEARTSQEGRLHEFLGLDPSEITPEILARVQEYRDQSARVEAARNRP